MSITKKFESLSMHDSDIAGGKGASLGEMTQAKIPVPPGFVILSSAFDRFLEETELDAEIDGILDFVDINMVHTIENASKKIQNLIITCHMPDDIRQEIMGPFKDLGAKYVAVRSSASAEDSAAAAWAGQLNSYLNVTEEYLIISVLKCWASLFTPRAIFYRVEKKMHDEHISVAIVVQKMVNSEVAGIAFSVHPVTEDYNQMIIEAGFGLGEAVVSGQITPDNYIIKKEPLHITNIHVKVQSRLLYRVEDKELEDPNIWKTLSVEEGSRQALSKEQILELAKIILRIEKHYKFPCDVEWAYENQNFYIVQSRPITTLQPKQHKSADLISVTESSKMTSKEQKKISEGKYRWNVRRDRYIPCIWPQITHYNPRFYKYTEIDIPVIHATIWEKGYCKVLREEECDKKLGEKQLNILLQQSANLKKIREKGITTCTLALDFCKEFSKKTYERIDPYIKFLDDFIPLYEAVMWDNMIFWVLTNTPLEKRIMTHLQKYSEDERQEIINTMFQLTTDSYSEIIEDEFQKLLKEFKSGEEKKELREHIKNFSDKYFWFPYEYVGPGIWDFDTVVKKLETSELDHKEKDYVSIVNNQKACIEKYSLSDEIVTLFKVFELTALMQDDRKGTMSETCYYLNGIILPKLAELLAVSREEILYVDQDILRLYKKDPGKAISILRERVNFTLLFQIDQEVTIVEGEKARQMVEELGIVLHETHPDSKKINGQIANKGKVVGRARILKTSQIDSFENGLILVTGMTTPDFMPLAKKAIALITDEGGITCHAAIISRELNIPCIIGTNIATKVLKDGELVEVNADQGVINILE